MFKNLIIRLILLTFITTSIGPFPDVSAQSIVDLPAPGSMVYRSEAFEPLQLKGILVNIKNPLSFDFLVDKGNSGLYGQPLKDGITRLAKYFLTCLTVPEDDLWVNLSPYEKDRIVPGNFGITVMGNDLLEQDYLLKQIMASLSYPENELGKRFWQRVYKKSYDLYGTTNIPINTFNKVWIIPQTAEVYAQGNGAFVVDSRLDVLLEADYKSYLHRLGNKGLGINSQGFIENAGAYSQVFREVILPELRQEINEGKNFAVVRQVFNAMILATWYKRHLKDSLLGRMYIGQDKVMGVDIADKNAKEKIFQQYLKAYKKCVYNYIKEDYDPITEQTVPRKYASGGMYFAGFGGPRSVYIEKPNPNGMKIGTDLAMATVDVTATNKDGKLISFPDMRAKITNTNPFHQVPLEAREAFLPPPEMSAVSNDRAMFVPRFIRPMILTIALAVTGFLMSPTMVSAAAPVTPNIQITADMKTQDAFTLIDNQVSKYQSKVKRQESLLNMFGIFGKAERSNVKLGGLQREEVFIQSLISEGRTTLDQPAVISLEISNLTGQRDNIDQQIKQRQQKIKNEVGEFNKRKQTFDMHAAEVSMRQGSIRYNEGVLKGLIAEKNKINNKIKLDQQAQEFTSQVVSNAVSSGSVVEGPSMDVRPPAVQAAVITNNTPAAVTPPAVQTSVVTNAPVVVTPPAVQAAVITNTPAVVTAPAVQTSVVTNAPVVVTPPAVQAAVITNTPAIVTPPAVQAAVITNTPAIVTPPAVQAAVITNTPAVVTPPAVQAAVITNTPAVVTPPAVQPVTVTNTPAAVTPQIVWSAPTNISSAVKLPSIPSSVMFSSPINAPLAQLDIPAPSLSSSSNTPSAGSSPPPPKGVGSEIFQLLSEPWAAYTGLAILGLGLTWGGITILRKNRLSNKLSEDQGKSPNVPTANNGRSGAWGFNVVTDNGPAVPNDQELAWQQQQQQIQVVQAPVALEPLVPPAENHQSGSSGLRVMDALGLGLSAGLAAIFSGGDLKTILTASLSSLFLTRLIYAGYIFLHENGHNATALIQSPQNYKKTLTWPNIFANYNLPNWLRLSFAFGKPTQRPGVDLPFLYGKARSINRIAGFVISSAVCGLAFWAAVKSGLWMPLFGSLSAASLFAVLNSLQSDIKGTSHEGRIECGDSGFIWLPKKHKPGNSGSNAKKPQAKDFFPRFVQDGLVNMREISGLRGDQGKGMVTLVETRDGDVVPVGFKVLKQKRGKPVAKVAQEGFNDELQGALDQGMQPLDTAREVTTHDRFLTQGIPSLKGLHPHLGVTEKRTLCFYKDGEYQKRARTIVSIVIENGDNNFHMKHGRKMPTRDIREFYPRKFHMKKNVFIEPNPKFPKGYFDYLPSGDAPALALQEQWYDNQGDWWAASRFAADEIFYKNDREAMEQNLTEDEEGVMGDFYMRVYEDGHEQILIRPKLEKKNKTLTDSWVTQEMVAKDDKFAFQYNALQRFRADLKRELLNEAGKARRDQNASAVGNILNRLQQLHPEEGIEGKVDRFVNMTVERFFTADIMEAAKEIDNLEVDGAYGVRIISTKYPGRGVFWTKGQSIALGVNKEAGYIAYNSEHTALMTKFGDAPPVKEILFLNSEGRGQLTETNYNESTEELDVRAWSPEKNRFLTENELKEWRMGLNEKNPYWTPLVERDPETVTDEDIDDITKVTYEIKKRWEDPKSFVRQSAANFVDKLESRFVESYIKTNSRFYRIMQGNLLFYVEQEAKKSQIAEQYSPEEAQRRVAALLREIQNDPRVLSYLKSRLDQLVAYEADVLSEQIRKGRKTEDVLFSQLKRIDENMSDLMFSEIRILTERLIRNNVQFLNDFQNEQGELSLNQNELEQLWNSDEDKASGVLKPRAGGEGLPSNESVGSGEAVIYASGLEDSLWIGAENFREMMQAFFPAMPIETDSSNKALDLRPNDRHKVGRRSLGFIVSKSGATSPTKNLVSPLKQITSVDNIFAMTGIPDTLLGLSLGQRYDEEAPFCRRIFPTGHIYPTEVNSVSEVELLVNQIELVLYIVKRMKKTFPNQRPWGMNVSDENIKKLEEWRDNLVTKGRHLTGVDEQGNPGIYPEHEKIIHDAKIFGKMITETPLSNLANRAYVFSIIYLGVPVGALAAYVERKTGLSVSSSGWGHLAWALLDTTIACTMPWWITTRFYRLFSGRVQRSARLGPPKVFIGDTPVLHQVVEVSASKRGSNAIGSMDVEYHGGNPQDHFGARFGHRSGGRSGKLIIYGLPEDPHALSHVLLTDSQSNVKTDMSVGNKIWDNLFGKRFSGGPEIFTIGPGDVDPNLSQHHMSTGPLETVIINKNGDRELGPGVTETLAHFHALSFEVYDRLTVYNVFFNKGYQWATNWGPWQIWKQGESFSKTGVFSTPSPRNGPKKKMSDFHDSGQVYSNAKSSSNGQVAGKPPADGSKGDIALLSNINSPQTPSRDGGINMSSRLMRLRISGKDQSQVSDDDNVLPEAVMNGVIPRVSGIVTVTPDMLETMLAKGYMN